MKKLVLIRFPYGEDLTEPWNSLDTWARLKVMGDLLKAYVFTGSKNFRVFVPNSDEGEALGDFISVFVHSARGPRERAAMMERFFEGAPSVVRLDTLDKERARPDRVVEILAQIREIAGDADMVFVCTTNRLAIRIAKTVVEGYRFPGRFEIGDVIEVNPESRKVRFLPREFGFATPPREKLS